MNNYSEGSAHDLAWQFLEGNGLNPTPDACEQLAEAFLPALRIMIERGYDPTGATWKKGGWRGLLHESRKKLERMWHRSWLHGQYDPDSALDGINYYGMYLRLACKGPSWGEWGEPQDDGVSRISLGDYSDVTP